MDTRLHDESSEGAHKGFNFRKNAARERGRVKSLRVAFQRLQDSLPWVPSDTKLSKLDILQLAIYHIQNLMKILDSKDTSAFIEDDRVLHPLKKWPMRSRLFVGSYDQYKSEKDSSQTNNRSAMLSSGTIHTIGEISNAVIEDSSIDWHFEAYEDDFSEFFLPASVDITIQMNQDGS